MNVTRTTDTPARRPGSGRNAPRICQLFQGLSPAGRADSAPPVIRSAGRVPRASPERQFIYLLIRFLCYDFPYLLTIYGRFTDGLLTIC
jgi:hypothetical protein